MLDAGFVNRFNLKLSQSFISSQSVLSELNKLDEVKKKYKSKGEGGGVRNILWKKKRGWMLGKNFEMDPKCGWLFPFSEQLL